MGGRTPVRGEEAGWARAAPRLGWLLLVSVSCLGGCQGELPEGPLPGDTVAAPDVPGERESVPAGSSSTGAPPTADTAPAEPALPPQPQTAPRPPVAQSPAAPSPPRPYPRACPDLYADDVLPTFEVEISDDSWRLLEEELATGSRLETYHPITFRYQGEVVHDAMIRLRGNNSDCGSKMQFAISFNEVNEAGRFHGLRRLNLDHGGCRLFRDRLALSYLRDLGVPAACANHARLVVNGRYYGLFVNIEHVNKDFLKRNFAEHDGNLYKSGDADELRTNEEEADTSDVDALWRARDVHTLSQQVDLREALLEWAAEATLPARDNYWLRGWNYYLYHHPTRGFLFIPTDMDQAFPPDASSAALDVFLPEASGLQRPADIVLADPTWRAHYLQAVQQAIAAFDAPGLEERLDRWQAQTGAAARADPTVQEGEAAQLKRTVRARASWLRTWRSPGMER